MNLQTLLTSEIEKATPFRIWTLAIFIAAIIHTMLANQFFHLAKKVERRHKKPGVSFLAESLFFLGEIEVVFALWVVPLIIVTTFYFGWKEVITYLNSRVYVEPFFIVVMMSLASTKPIIELAERGVHGIGKFFGDSPASWWVTVLTIGPILGSIITEAAAMTIAVLLLIEKIYRYNPSKRLAYGTLGLTFVNFSVGGLLTNFAAPPAITLSRCWNWKLGDFFGQFGLPVLLGIALVNALYFFLLRKDFKTLSKPKKKAADHTKEPIPFWITLIHLAFIAWTIIMAHYPPVFMGGYLLFLGFHQATRHHQYELNLRRPLLVGLFLAGLVIHAGFQGWWIDPLMGDLQYGPLMAVGTVLTAFNENTTVSYLACLLDDLTPQLKYAIASGLVVGGGLTIIAHAPNPAGQALVRKYFKNGVSQFSLFVAALLPTLLFLGIFYLIGLL